MPQQKPPVMPVFRRPRCLAPVARAEALPAGDAIGLRTILLGPLSTAAGAGN